MISLALGFLVVCSAVMAAPGPYPGPGPMPNPMPYPMPAAQPLAESAPDANHFYGGHGGHIHGGHHGGHLQGGHLHGGYGYGGGYSEVIHEEPIFVTGAYEEIRSNDYLFGVPYPGYNTLY